MNNSNDDTAPWTAASESLRSVVKWIAASFGALGALLIGTAPLAGLRKLNASADWTDWLVPIGFGVFALIGVGFIVWQATSLLTPSTITLLQVQKEREFDPLRKQVAADPTAYLGSWGRDVNAFIENRDTEFTTLENFDEKIASLPSNTPELQSLITSRPVVLKRIEACAIVTARLLAIAGFDALSRRFSNKKVWMFIAAGVVVVGVVGFIASTPGDDEQPPKDPSAVPAQTTPGDDKPTAKDPMTVPALLSLTPTGITEVKPDLGIECTNPIEAVLLTGDAEGPWRLMITDDRCQNGTLTVSKEQAVVMEVYRGGK